MPRSSVPLDAVATLGHAGVASDGRGHGRELGEGRGGRCSRASSPDFALQPLRAERAGEFGQQNIHCDGALVAEPLGQVDDRRAAAPESVPAPRVSRSRPERP
jgi:hypothetical protein